MVTVPKVVEPFLNVTDPVATLGVTTALNVTFVPKTGAAFDTLSVTVVGALPEVILTVRLAAFQFAFPAKSILMAQTPEARKLIFVTWSTEQINGVVLV